MKVAVTGGTGFLGQALVEVLRAAEHSVVAIARGEKVAPEGLELRRADLVEASSWNGVFDGCDAVIHAAAGIAYERRARAWLETVNVEGTRIVCEEALRAGVERFVHISSVSAIGDSRDGTPLDEESPFTAERWGIGYFETKRDAEQEIHRAISRGLPATIVNPGAIFGPSSVRANTNEFLKAIASGRLPFTPPGALSLVDVRSVSRGVILAMESGVVGRRYLLTTESLSFEELFDRVASLGGRARWRPRVPEASLAMLRMIAATLERLHWTPAPFTRESLAALSTPPPFTSERARRELGWTPTPLDD
ncbi:MAG: NAD-dependent epimerase/dehydratase family protein, partial [Planctomycetota bacterium]